MTTEPACAGGKDHAAPNTVLYSEGLMRLSHLLLRSFNRKIILFGFEKTAASACAAICHRVMNFEYLWKGLGGHSGF